MPAGTRRRAREAALKILFQMDLGAGGADESIEAYWDCFDLEAEGDAYAEELVRGVEADRETVDRAIREASTRWRLERMAPVDRNVLRIGAWELLRSLDVPTRVVLDEAIELAKRYGAEDSSAFVNGVLDRVARSLREGEPEEAGEGGAGAEAGPVGAGAEDRGEGEPTP